MKTGKRAGGYGVYLTRKMMDEVANHATQIGRYVERYAAGVR